MDLCQLGALLREERERRGLSLDDVSEKIKISRTCLAAIEEGNEGGLPHPVYAKGFIKNYATLLGLADDAFLENLSQLYQLEQEPVQHIPLIRDIVDGDESVPHHTAAAGLARFKRLAVPAAILVVVAGAGWYGYRAFFGGKPAAEPVASKAVSEPTPKTVPAPPTVPPVSAGSPTTPPAPAAGTPAAPPASPDAAAGTAPAPAPVPTPAPQTPPTGQATAPQAAPAGPASAPAPTPEDRATQDIALSGQAAAAPEAAAPAPQGKHFTVGDRGDHVVTLKASGRCWLQAGADGGVMHDSMMQAGDTFTGRFNNYLLMRLGNAGAVEIQFDGNVYPLHASKGSVKTLKFIGHKTDDAASAKPAADGKAPSDKPAAAPDKPAAATDQPAAAADQPAAAADKPAPAVDKPAAAEATSGAAKELEVYGQDGSWVILMPDTGPAKEVYVKKGQRMKIPFGDKIEVKLGNPSNVIFRYDGKETPVTTERGETKTVRFP